MLNAFIASQKQNDMQKFKPASVRRGYLLRHLIMAIRENASHWLIMMAAVCSNFEELEHLDKYDHVAAKVLKTRIRTAR